jgi:hypothetical protein
MAFHRVRSERLLEKGEGPDDRRPPDDPGNPTVNFDGEKRSNETHQSTTDPEAKLARKGNNQPAKLRDLANALMENRNGLLVDLRVEPATGTGERIGALAVLDEHLPDRPDPRPPAPLGRRWQGDQARGLRSRPTPSEAGRREHRLDEDRRLLQEDAIQRPIPDATRGPHGRRRLQPASDGDSDGRPDPRPSRRERWCYHK